MDAWDEIDLTELDDLDEWDLQEVTGNVLPSATIAPKAPVGPPAPSGAPVAKAGPPTKSGGVAPTKNPTIPNLPKLPPGINMPEFPVSKHNTDDILDEAIKLLKKADTQEDEPSLNACLAIAGVYLQIAEFLGQKELQQRQAQFQAQFDAISNAQRIGQADAEHKVKLKQIDDQHKLGMSQAKAQGAAALAAHKQIHATKVDFAKKTAANRSAGQKTNPVPGQKVDPTPFPGKTVPPTKKV